MINTFSLNVSTPKLRIIIIIILPTDQPTLHNSPNFPYNKK